MGEQVELGREERVELREVWQYEARDFTSWLTQNIDLLNEHLPFGIDPDLSRPTTAILASC